MTSAVQPTARRAIARPLTTLVPLIQHELAAGNSAGIAHFRRAGEMLLEARESGQATGSRWTAWLTRNFQLSKKTAYRYMRLAERAASGSVVDDTTLYAAIGERPSGNSPGSPRHTAWKPFHEATEKIDVKHLAQERQTVADEVKLHRDLALELIDLGFKALATRLHPDKGGSKGAMARLNRVRVELRDVATTRRFV